MIVIARGGGSVEDLLPFSDEALVRAVHACPHPGRLGDRPRARLARCSTWSPTSAPPPRPTPPSWSCPTWPRSCAAWRVARDRLRSSLGGVAGPRAGRARRAALAAGARRPAQPARRPRATRSTSSATAPAARSAHALDRAADDIDHQRARARALSPLATLQRGYAVLQDADGHVVTLGRRGRRRRRRSASGSPTAASTPPPTGIEPRPRSGEDHRRPPRSPHELTSSSPTRPPARS